MSYQPVKVVFIGGPSRAGSTLLDRMLGQLDHFASVGELRYLWERGFVQEHYCGCGVPLLQCDFWQAVLERAFGQTDKADGERFSQLARSVDRPRYIPQILLSVKGSDFKRRLDEYRAVLLSLYRAIAAVSGADFIVDSSKEPSSAFVMLGIPGIDLRLVHLVRDSRAVAFSWLRRKLTRPGVNVSSRDAYINVIRPGRSSLVWVYRNIALELLRLLNKRGISRQPASMSDDYIFVRYEDFVTDPRRVFNSVISSLGAKGSMNFISDDNELTLKDNHTASGNPMRFSKGIIRIRLDDEWRQNMRTRDKSIVTLLSFPWLLKYGYILRKGG